VAGNPLTDFFLEVSCNKVDGKRARDEVVKEKGAEAKRVRNPRLVL